MLVTKFTAEVTFVDGNFVEAVEAAGIRHVGLQKITDPRGLPVFSPRCLMPVETCESEDSFWKLKNDSD